MATFLLFLVCGAFLVVGISAGRSHGRETASSSEFMVAQRRLPMWMACLTLAATWIGGGYINGTAEAVYDPEQGLVWCQAPWCYALSLIIGGLVFARPMRNRGYRTMLDLFEQHHGPRIAAALFVPALIGDLFWTAAILSALGSTLGVLFGIDTTLGVCLSASVVIAYTAFGGLWSVACSDILQLACIVFGLAITLPFALQQCGGLRMMSVEYTQMFGDRAQLLPTRAAWSGADPWAWQWLDSALLLICGGIPWQVYFQRILACRTANTAVGMSVLAGFICLAIAIAPALLGGIGACVDWSHYPSGPPATPAVVLPHVLRHIVPPAVSLIGLMALVAAVMSSMDSSILSSASMFAWNVYRPLRRVDAESPEIHRVLRWAIVFLGALAITLALSVKSVYQLWYLSSDLVYVILFPQLVMALFFRRVTPAGAIAGATVAVTLRLAIGLSAMDRFAPYIQRVAWPQMLRYVPWLTLAMLASLATIAIVSLLSGHGPPSGAERTTG